MWRITFNSFFLFIVSYDSYFDKTVKYAIGGNQREVDRLRSEARHSKKGTGEKKEGNPIARNEKY